MVKIISGFLLLVFLPLYITNCTPDNEPESQPNNEQSATYPTHNSQNSLDWAGTYQGITPCADCEGIETNLVLHYDQTYELSTRYVGKSDDLIHTNGSFRWDESGNQIILDVEENSRPSEYIIQENRIVQLDMDGNRITSDLAEAYVLEKDSNTITDRYWKLTALQGMDIDTTQTGPKKPHIILHPLEGTVSGNGGCNSFSGSYTLTDKNEVSFSQLASTRMACESAIHEHLFFTMLDSAQTFSITGDTLTLYQPDTTEIVRFVESRELN